MHTTKTRQALSLGTLCLLTLLAMSLTFASGDDNRGGKVLPPNAKPYGYSLDHMAKAMALFSTSGNSMPYYPTTPFQILFAPAQTYTHPTCQDGNPGTLASGTQTFPVIAGEALFVPLFFYDDSPPVVGTWPTDPSMVEDYIFGPTHFGTSGTEIILDGTTTAVGPDFLGGPIKQSKPPLLDGGGKHFIQLGAFLAPMSVGSHTVEIKGQIGNSAEFIAAAGSIFGDCLEEDITYTVKVFPPLRRK